MVVCCFVEELQREIKVISIYKGRSWGLPVDTRTYTRNPTPQAYRGSIDPKLYILNPECRVQGLWLNLSMLSRAEMHALRNE